LSGSR